MTRRCLLFVPFVLAAARGPVAAAETVPVPAAHGATITRHDRVPPTSRPAVEPVAPNGVIVSPWTQLGPGDQPGPTRRAALSNFGFSVSIGSDEAGLFRGFPFADSFWDPLGDELDSGVHHLAIGYYVPALGHRPQATPGGGSAIQGTPERIVVATSDGRVRWSSDDGYTWYEPIGLDPRIDGCRRLLRDGNFSNVVYLLAHASDSLTGYPYFKVYQSYDVGESWNETYYFDASGGEDIDLFVRRDALSEVYLVQGNSGDVFVSVDNTFTFSPRGQVLPSTSGGWQLTGIETDSALYALCDGDGTIHRSLDWGLTWAPHGTANANGTGGLCGAILSSGVLLEGGAREAGAGEGGWWSDDGGVTWTAFDPTDWLYNNTRLCPDVLGIDCLLPVVIPTGRPGGAGPGVEGVLPVERFYVHTAGGSYVWYYDAATPPAPELLSVTNFLNGQYLDALSRYVDPALWDLDLASRGRAQQRASGTPVLGAFAHVSSSATDDVGTVSASYALNPVDPYVWSQFDGIVVLVGPGEFGVTVDPPDANAKPRHPFLMADPAAPFDLIWGGASLWRIRYNTATNLFTSTELASGFSLDFYERIAGVGISPADHTRWYLCTSYGRIFTSADNGSSWTLRSLAGPVTNDAIWQQLPVVPDPVDANGCVVAGEAGVVLRTDDGGATWTPLDSGLPAGTRVWDLAYDNATDRTLYAATEDGPFVFQAGSWVDLAPAYNIDAIPEVPFRTVHSVPWQGVMRWGTRGRGLYDLSIGAPSAVAGPGPVEGAPLLAVRPAANPLRSAAAVDITLPAAGRVRLDLFDAAGRRVRALLDEHHPAGSGRLTIDLDRAGRLPDGVYFLRMSAEGGVATTRVVVARH